MKLLKLSAVVPALLVLGGCSSVQRDTPIQVWDDTRSISRSLRRRRP